MRNIKSFIGGLFKGFGGSVFIILLAIGLLLLSNFNDYKVIETTGQIIIVDRKGEHLQFVDFTRTYKVGDEITLYGDYDWHYKHLVININN